MEAARDQRIMDLTLAVKLRFIVILFRQTGFHLFEALVVHFRGIDMASHNFGAESFCQVDTHINCCIGMVGIIDRNIDRLIH